LSKFVPWVEHLATMLLSVVTTSSRLGQVWPSTVLITNEGAPVRKSKENENRTRSQICNNKCELNAWLPRAVSVARSGVGGTTAGQRETSTDSAVVAWRASIENGVSHIFPALICQNGNWIARNPSNRLTGWLHDRRRDSTYISIIFNSNLRTCSLD
jgi:hypothetical protein